MMELGMIGLGKKEDMIDEATLLVYEMNGGASDADERGRLERPTVKVQGR